jgi:hypothetical protein
MFITMLIVLAITVAVIVTLACICALLVTN